MKIQDTTTYKPPNIENKKTNPILLWLSIIAIVIFILGAKIAFAPKKVDSTINVVGAGQDLTANTKLGFGHLHYISIPKKFFKPNMYTSSDMVAGKISKNNIRLGEPILKENLFAQTKSLSHKLNSNLMAYTIKLSDEGILNNSIMENDRINLIYINSENDNAKAVTICQNLKVLSAPEKCLSKDQNNSTDNLLTIEVNETQAQKIALASNNGKIVVTLCNPNVSVIKENYLKPTCLEDLVSKKKESKPMTNINSSNILIPPPPAIEKVSAQLSDSQKTNDQDYDKWIVEKFTGSEKEEICIPR